MSLRRLPRALSRAVTRALPLVLLAASCGGNTLHQDVRVMSFSPQGAVDKAESIVIRFDKPVVAKALVNQPVAAADVRVSPSFLFKGYWQDAQTLVLEPVAPLAASTRYEVALVGALGVRTGAFKLAFVNQPLAVDGVWGVDASMLDPKGAVPVSFNQAVLPADAAAHCKLLAPTGTIGLGGTGPAGANLALVPARPLVSGVDYTLQCDGLAGAGGNAPLDKPYSLAVSARPALAVESVTPTGTDIPADEVGIAVRFTTPVTLDAARAAASSRPVIPGLDKGYLSDDGLEYTVTANLEAQTAYTVTVAGTLVDTFGQPLGAAATATFHTGTARPRLSMERGIFAVEASAAGYPLWTRNIDKFSVECGAIPRSKLVQVLTTDMNYDAWGGNDDDKPVDWKALHVTAKTTPVVPGGKDQWRLNELELPRLCGGAATAAPGGRGVFLTEVTSDDVKPDATRGWMSPRRNRVLANVTDLGVLIKVGTSSGLVWVTSLATGKPVSGARVAVYDPKAKQVFAGATDAQGLMMIPGSALLKQQKPAPGGDVDEDGDEETDWDSYRSQRLIAIVETDKDLAVVDGNWSNGIQMWNFGVTEDRSGGPTKIRGFIQSDRGLYRPGETASFKGIAREVISGQAPRVPAKAPVKVEVSDSRGAVVLTTKTKLSAFGGFAFDLPLGPEAATGDYYVSATVAEQVFRMTFTVQEFRAASFEVALKSQQAAPKPGARLMFDLDASYLMGSPVVAGNVEWSLRKRKHVIAFEGYESYTFSANPSDFWSYGYGSRDGAGDYGEFIADGAGATDVKGHLAIAARDEATAFDGPVDYVLSANVTDEADQTMGKSTIVTAHKTGFYLGLFANEWVQAVGMPFGVNIVALAPDGSRIATTAKLTVTRTVNTCVWDTVGSRSYQHCDASTQPMVERSVDLASAGSHTERINPTAPGDYTVKITATDAAGNQVVAATEIYVIGKGEAFWSGDEGARMTLIASKPTYAVGDTARLVAQANLVAPTALVTIERDGIIEAHVKQLASASEGVELPIVAAWAPNVFASVALVSGRHGAGDRNRPQFKMGLVELKVSAAQKELAVGITLERATVRPGEPVVGTIRVLSNGQPVKAEVSLSAADEGILQLIAYETPNPIKTFYAAYGLGVDSGTNWNRVARIADPQSGDPDEGGDSESTLAGQRVRSKFVASAYWAPMLVTDARGEIRFRFTAPDNLTAFRLMAVAADAGDRFGAGELRLTVNKPLMAAPALPQFLRTGDAASVGVVLHNHTDRAGTATVTATANGATLAGSTTQTVTLPANGEARVRFAATTSGNAAATFEFGATMNGEQDRVAVTVPIDRPRIIDHRLLVEKKLAPGEPWTGSLALSADVLRAESTLTVSVDQTGVGDLAPGLRALVEYPYGCLEQTMSRFIPLVAAKDLAKTLEDPTLQGTQANQFIRAGVQKVIRHQQGDGMFSLWPQSQTYPHLTAYALWGLTVAEQAGETVPPEVFANGINALETWVASKASLAPDGDGATAAMAAYVMALRGKPDVALMARLYGVRAGMPKWGQAFLLRAMVKAKSDPTMVAALETLLVADLVVTGDRAVVKEGLNKEQYVDYMDSDVRATAMTLAALLEADPKSALVDPLAAGLKSQRLASGSWQSTQENLWSLVALSAYARRSPGGTTTLAVTVGGKTTKRTITGAQVATQTFAVGDAGAGAIGISVDSPANITARVKESRVDAGAAVANGFAIERRYVNAAGIEQAAFAAGDVVTVKLTVVVAAAQKWVALVDPLPAGLEVMNSKLAAGGVRTKATPGADAGADGDGGAYEYWRGLQWVHQDVRDDRVEWFADSIEAGTYEMNYQARATIDGTFATMPATIEAMYEPTIRGRTTRGTLRVTK